MKSSDNINFKKIYDRESTLNKKIYYSNYLFACSIFSFYLSLIHFCLSIVKNINISLIKNDYRSLGILLSYFLLLIALNTYIDVLFFRNKLNLNKQNWKLMTKLLAFKVILTVISAIFGCFSTILFISSFAESIICYYVFTQVKCKIVIDSILKSLD